MREPWWRKQTKHWYVLHNGKQHRLSREPDPDGADREDPPPAVQTAWLTPLAARHPHAAEGGRAARAAQEARGGRPPGPEGGPRRPARDRLPPERAAPRPHRAAAPRRRVHARPKQDGPQDRRAGAES